MLLLAPEIWRIHGGIQRYMRMIVQILEERGDPFAVLSLLDADDDCPSGVRQFCTLARGSKVRFTWQALRLGYQGWGNFLIVGHVGLLPVAWVLWRLKLAKNYAVVLHGLEAWYRLPLFMRVAARGASHIIATTHYTAREFCFYNGLDIGRCVVIPLAARASAPVPREAPGNTLKLVAVTRLSIWDGYKGIDTALRAVRLAIDGGLSVTLDIIGSGNDAARLETLAATLGITTVVNFRGSVTDEELAQVYGQSHIFVMPSKKEGFGIVFVEAMGAGLPCIGANHGGIPEVIEHGESGYLVEYGDVEQMVIYLRALLESPELYDRFSRAARQRASEVLGYSAMARSWGKLLDVELDVPAPGRDEALQAVPKKY